MNLRLFLDHLLKFFTVFSKLGTILIVASLFFGLTSSGVEANSKVNQSLNFREILESDDNSDSSYGYGRIIVPHYSYYGLVDNFMAKNMSDFSLGPKDIKFIQIKKEPSLRHKRHDIPVCTITIYLYMEAARRMRDFTERNLNKRFALEINGKILTTAKILEVVEDKMKLTFTVMSLAEIKSAFERISDHIQVDDN